MHSLTTKAIESSKKKQRSDYPVSDVPFYRRNPPSPPMVFFDDTAVTVFEIALSLEMQNAFKQDDISFSSRQNVV